MSDTEAPWTAVEVQVGSCGRAGAYSIAGLPEASGCTKKDRLGRPPEMIMGGPPIAFGIGFGLFCTCRCKLQGHYILVNILSRISPRDESGRHLSCAICIAIRIWRSVGERRAGAICAICIWRSVGEA